MMGPLLSDSNARPRVPPSATPSVDGAHPQAVSSGGILDALAAGILAFRAVQAIRSADADGAALNAWR